MSISLSEPQDTDPANPAAIDAVRLVILHRPGPAWNPDVGPIEQQGVAAHLDYLRKGADQGLVLSGGPFLGDMQGGMMIIRPGIDREEIEVFCGGDPAVKSGLIEFEIRAWLVTIDLSATN